MDDTRSRDTVSTTLLGRLKNRDDDAFARLHGIFSETVRRRLQRLEVASNDIPDLSQAIFARVARGIEGFTPDGSHASFRRWLMTIIRNAAFDYHKKPRASLINTDQLRQLAEDDDVAENEEVVAEVHRMLASVEKDFEPETFQAFVSFWIRGEDTDTIASRYRKSAGAIREGRRRVLRRLREEYYEIYGSADWPLR